MVAGGRSLHLIAVLLACCSPAHPLLSAHQRRDPRQTGRQRAPLVAAGSAQDRGGAEGGVSGGGGGGGGAAVRRPSGEELATLACGSLILADQRLIDVDAVASAVAVGVPVLVAGLSLGLA